MSLWKSLFKVLIKEDDEPSTRDKFWGAVNWGGDKAGSEEESDKKTSFWGRKPKKDDDADSQDKD